MNDLVLIGIGLLYIAIGVFVNALMLDDEFSVCLLLFWPLAIAAFVVLILVVGIPHELGQWLKGKW